jgi:hypothetical protein
VHIDLKHALLRTTQLEIPLPPAPEMPFSGQYAAAQLEKLDNSPMFRGRTFSLAKEIAGYLGYAPDFAPPAFVRWACVHGRLPCIDDDVYDGRVKAPMLVEDFSTDFDYDDDSAIVKYLEPNIEYQNMLEITTVRTDPERIPRLSRLQVLFGITIDVNANLRDIRFCQRWFRDHAAGWPHTADGIHPSLSGAVRIYEQHHAIWAALVREQTMIRLRHNRGQL